MLNVILYSTSACHLCDLAEQMLLEEGEAGAPLSIEKVDISESDELFARYGLLIPVLRLEDGRELGWPFSPNQLREFIGPG